MVVVGLWRVVSEVGKDSVEDVEGFEGFMHLGLPSLRSISKIWFNKDEKSSY